MPTELPPYYFRVRDNGAAVFRVDAENRNLRVEMEQIAVVNLRNGEIRAQGGRTLGDADLAAIRAWVARRQETLARREIEDVHRSVDQLNHVAQWAQSRATDAELDEVTDALLMAMNDLRSVLVRRKADRLGGPPDDGG